MLTRRAAKLLNRKLAKVETLESTLLLWTATLEESVGLWVAQWRAWSAPMKTGGALNKFGTRRRHVEAR